MLEKFGIISNCWAKVLENGVPYEDLVKQFSDQGFGYQEVRDAEYLRATDFGRYLGAVEGTMGHYSDASWKEICDAIHQKQEWGQIVMEEDRPLFERAAHFFEITQNLVITYAAAHRWLNAPKDMDEDNERIRKAVKLASLLCTPGMERLRLVDVEPLAEIDTETAVSNLNRYRSLLPDYPMLYAVEHAHQTVPQTYELALQGGFLFAYDEANIFIKGAPEPGELDDFWSNVKLEDITSIHLKQRDAEGFTSSIAAEGFVDFRVLIERLTTIGYEGEFLLENVPADQPMEDALESRAFILGLKT